MSKAATKISALRVVESAPFFEQEIDLSDSNGGEAHSLHDLASFPEGVDAALPSYFIKKFTRRGDVVFDPFAGSGTVAVEAAIQGRVAFSSDLSPLSKIITNAKLCPADLTEVTMKLQGVNFRRPINLDLYRSKFASFYDVDTFREIANLRAFTKDSPDKVSQFIEVIALGLLHGHSAGYFSVPTFPQVSLSPQEQETINLKRRQVPDYRAVMPRILRKTAASFRDGYPSVLRVLERSNKIQVADARDVSYVPSDSVDLMLTQPPVPGSRDYNGDLWLKLWFSQVQPVAVPQFPVDAKHEWLEFMNEVLFESARVVKRGGRCVLDLKEIRSMGANLKLDHEVRDLVDEHLSRYWEPECSLVNTLPVAKIKNCLKERDSSRLERGNRVLVLRRR